MSTPDPRISSENLLKPHHRDVGGGPVRAAVFGMSDGLVSNVSLVLGVAGANPGAGYVRLAGLAGLVAGAFSMAVGEYVSMKAQTELLEFELSRERIELSRRPHIEHQELVAIYEQRGISNRLAEELATELMRDPETALETHAREELGVNPHNLGSPVGAAASSFATFCVGALIPLLPWFFVSGTAATLGSILLAAIAAVVLGFSLGKLSGRSPTKSALRQLLLSAAAASVTYAIGRAVGVGV